MSDAPSIRILSADAPKTGLRQCVERHAHAAGISFELELLTAPRIRDRVEAGEARADIVVVPLPVMQELAVAGHVDADSIGALGSVTVGVVVRNGARDPDLSSVETFRDAVLAADTVVYNTASSGLYVAQVLERLGLKEAIAERSVVVNTGVAVIEELIARGDEDAVGFGHITEIRLHDDKGTHLVGALPEEIGRHTVYAAGILSGAADKRSAGGLISFLVSPEGREVFKASGVI